MLDTFLPTLALTIGQAVDGLQGIYTFDNLPASLGALPCLIVMPARGTLEASGANVALHDIQAVIYCSPSNLPESYLYCVRAVYKVGKAISTNIKLGGLVQHCLPAPAPAPFYEIGTLNTIYANKDYIGVIFHLEVKENNDYQPEA